MFYPKNKQTTKKNEVLQQCWAQPGTILCISLVTSLFSTKEKDGLFSPSTPLYDIAKSSLRGGLLSKKGLDAWDRSVLCVHSLLWFVILCRCLWSGQHSELDMLKNLPVRSVLAVPIAVQLIVNRWHAQVLNYSSKGLLSTRQDLWTYKYIKARMMGYNLCLAQSPACCKHSFSKCVSKYLHCALTAGRANAGEGNLFDTLLSFDRDPSCPQDTGRNKQWETSLGLDEPSCSTQEQTQAEGLLGSQSPYSLHLSNTRSRATLTTHPWTMPG